MSDVRYVNAPAIHPGRDAARVLRATAAYAHLARQFGGEGCAWPACSSRSTNCATSRPRRTSISHFQQVLQRDAQRAALVRPSGICRCPSYLEDALTSGRSEFLTAIGFSSSTSPDQPAVRPVHERVPRYNGDLSTVTFGFSAQSDEARTTLGIECVKFMLEQDPANAPIVQRWIDKWFWRGYRCSPLVGDDAGLHAAQARDELEGSREMYAESAGEALFADLARYGIRKPAGWEAGGEHISHQAWNTSCQLHRRRGLPYLIPTEEEMAWLERNTPTPFGTTGRAWSTTRSAPPRAGASTTRRCRCCARPARSRMLFTEPGNLRWIAYRECTHEGESHHFLQRRLPLDSSTSRRSTRPRAGYGATRSCRVTASGLARDPTQPGFRPAGRGARVLQR